MRSIIQLVQHMNKEGVDPNVKREYDAFKQLDDNVIELQNRIANLEKKNMKYFCRAYNDGGGTIASGVTSVVGFNKTEYPQFGNMHDNTISSGQIIIRRNGVYHMSAGIQWAATGGGTFRQIIIRVTRGGVALNVATQRVLAPAGAVILAMNCATSYYCYVDDYVQLFCVQDSGGPIDIVANYPLAPALCVAERMEDLSPAEYGLLDPNANTR